LIPAVEKEGGKLSRTTFGTDIGGFSGESSSTSTISGFSGESCKQPEKRSGRRDASNTSLVLGA
jgi:hypothetical protein